MNEKTFIIFLIENEIQYDESILNQLNRYMQDNIGNFGIFLTRNPLSKAMYENTVNLWSSQRKCIIAITDEDLKLMVRNLETNYLVNPECRHLETKTKIYRNIILGSYLIIYRIRANKIEVLRAFHGSRSPKDIKKVKQIKI